MTARTFLPNICHSFASFSSIIRVLVRFRGVARARPTSIGESTIAHAFCSLFSQSSLPDIISCASVFFFSLFSTVICCILPERLGEHSSAVIHSRPALIVCQKLGNTTLVFKVIYAHPPLRNVREIGSVGEGMCVRRTRIQYLTPMRCLSLPT